MSGQPFRQLEGGLIDRDRPLAFRFDGRAYTGFAGDTLASALLANGVKVVGRSFKYHRRRGIFGAGVEEPNALIALREGNREEPNLRATAIELFDGLTAASQNRWPSLDFDVGGITNIFSRFLPAGFYYKTFMWPGNAWMFYERIIRAAAGLGKAPTLGDPDYYERRFAHCDVLVVGAGPSGLSAALAAGRSGARVILVDDGAALGGSLRGWPASIGRYPRARLGGPGSRGACVACQRARSAPRHRFRLLRSESAGGVRADHRSPGVAAAPPAPSTPVVGACRARGARHRRHRASHCLC